MSSSTSSPPEMKPNAWQPPESSSPAGQPQELGLLLKELKERLSLISETPSLDAQVLLAHSLHQTRAWVIAHPESPVSTSDRRQVEQAIRRLENGEPLPYVLGHWNFFGLDFEISPAVLIPRPETELLVEQAITWLRSHPNRRMAADIGTGSGCIAVSLAVNVPDIKVLAADISLPALEIAQANARRHEVIDHIDFVLTDLIPAASQSFDLICANLPYIPKDVLKTLDVFEKEPALALDGGPGGLDLIRRLLRQAMDRVASGGLLLLEIEAGQGDRVLALARELYPQAASIVLPDLSGRDRLLKIQL